MSHNNVINKPAATRPDASDNSMTEATSMLLAAVPVAGDELSGDKVGGRAVAHISRIIFLVAAPLLGSCRREELDGVVGTKASYDEDSWGGFWSIVSWFCFVLFAF